MQFLLVIIVIPLLLVVLRCCLKAPRRPLPPGPVPLPVIGNILQIPREAPLTRIQEWTRTFGPILTFKIGSRTCILLASRTAVRDLLEKKSALYNNRPMLILGEHILDGLLPVLMPGSNKWHHLHRLTSYLLNPQAAKASRSLFPAAAACCLRDMVYGKNLCDHLLLVSVRPFFALLYGMDMSSITHYQTREIKATMATILTRLSPESGILDMFPALQYVPGVSRVSRRNGAAIWDSLMTTIRPRIEHALQQPSWNFTQAMYNRRKGLSWREFMVLMLEIEIGGYITINYTVSNLLNMSVMHPIETQQVQEELDHHIGNSRLPTLEDLPKLPFLNAFIKECFRLHPLFPLGFPHTPSDDDEYMGYRIPKDAFVFPFHYGFNTDDSTYSDPMSFRPRRWIDDPSLPDPAAFGYGKRTCPGQPFASEIVPIAVASMLWGYSFTNIGADQTDFTKRGANQNVAVLDSLVVREGVVSHIKFECRSESHRATILRGWQGMEVQTDKVLIEISACLGLN